MKTDMKKIYPNTYKPFKSTAAVFMGKVLFSIKPPMVHLASVSPFLDSGTILIIKPHSTWICV